MLALAASWVLAWPPSSAQAVISPATVVSGPSSGILGVGNVAIAPDGTGGVVWRALAGGVPHVFVSQFIDGTWSAPIQVDAGQPGPATFPAIAAGDGGRLLVVWVEPWVSESTGGNPPTTVYQLVSSEMEPGSDGFGPVVQVDPNSVGDGTGVYPAIAMAADGAAYVVYRVVTYAYPPGSPIPPGDPPQLQPGDQLVDVRVARYNGLFWNSVGTANVFPDQVTMRRPSASNAPAIAIGSSGDGLIVWQEPTIDGVARIWARRLFGMTLGDPLEVSPETVDGKPVSVDADAPAVSFNDAEQAAVAFRLGGGAGSPLSTPHILVNTILGKYDLTPGVSFAGAVPVAGAPQVGPPSVAMDSGGFFTTAFTAGGETETANGNATIVGVPSVLGPQAGNPALAVVNPDGGGATAWPTMDQAGRPVLDVSQTFPDGGYQKATLSARISGPISDLSLGPSGEGDALIAFEQGLGSTTQVVVSDVQAPPHNLVANGPHGWVRPGQARIRWQPATNLIENVIGPVTYSIAVDGLVRARGLDGRSYRFSRHQLGAGVHRVRVIAIDSAGEETFSPAVLVRVDPNPPRVIVRHLRSGGVRVSFRDTASGVDTGATVISFGDGSRDVRGRRSVVHYYATPGPYRITVRCENNVGIGAVDHIWVQAR